MEKREGRREKGFKTTLLPSSSGMCTMLLAPCAASQGFEGAVRAPAKRHRHPSDPEGLKKEKRSIRSLVADCASVFNNHLLHAATRVGSAASLLLTRQQQLNTFFDFFSLPPEAAAVDTLEPPPSWLLPVSLEAAPQQFPAAAAATAAGKTATAAAPARRGFEPAAAAALPFQAEAPIGSSCLLLLLQQLAEAPIGRNSLLLLLQQLQQQQQQHAHRKTAAAVALLLSAGSSSNDCCCCRCCCCCTVETAAGRGLQQAAAEAAGAAILAATQAAAAAAAAVEMPAKSTDEGDMEAAALPVLRLRKLNGSSSSRDNSSRDGGSTSSTSSTGGSTSSSSSRAEAKGLLSSVSTTDECGDSGNASTRSSKKGSSSGLVGGSGSNSSNSNMSPSNSSSSSSSSGSSSSSSSSGRGGARGRGRGGVAVQQPAAGSRTETEETAAVNTELLQRQQRPTPILRLSVHPRTGAVSRSQQPGGLASRASFCLTPARLHLSSSSSSSGGSTEHLQHEGYRERMHRAADGSLRWGEKEANDGSWVEKWAVQTVPQQQQQQQQQDRVLEFGQSQGRNYQTHERWISRWEETPSERRVEKLVQELQPQQQQQQQEEGEQQEEQQVLQEWEEEEVQELQMGIVRISKRGVDSRADSPRSWRLHCIRRQQPAGADAAAAAATGGSEAQAAAEKAAQELLAAAAAAPASEAAAAAARAAAAAASSLRVGEEIELFEETRGPETRGRMQRRDTRGTVVQQVLWLAADSTDTSSSRSQTEQMQLEADGRSRGSKRGIDENGEEWEEEWFASPDGTRETVRRGRGPGGSSWTERRGVRRREEGEGELEEYYRRRGAMESKLEAGRLVETHDSWTRPLSGGCAAGLKKKETHKYEGEQVVAVEVENEKWEDTGVEVAVDIILLLVVAIDLLQNRWGRKKGSRRTDGMEWGEQWEEMREAGADDLPEEETGTPQTIRLRILLPGGEVTSRDVLLASGRETLRLRRRCDDKWWREASGNSWGHKQSTEEDGCVKREKWYDNGQEKQVDWWEESLDGSQVGEKFGSKSDGTQWRERWGCGAGGSDAWEDKSWEEADPEREGGKLRWGFSSGSSAADGKQWQQQWREREHWLCGEKFVEKNEKNQHGDEQTLKEGNQWRRSEQCDREVTSWFEERFGVVENRNEKWAFKRGADEEGEWTERWKESPSEKEAEKTGWNKRGDAWEERWHEKFDGGVKTETWAEKKGSNAQGNSWMETWHEGWGFKSAHKEARDASGSRRVERWGERFFDDGSGEKWAQHWQEGPPPPGGGGPPAASSGKSWGDRWGSGGVGGHRWGEEWGPEGCRKWAHDTPGRPEGC
ncbi:hypothetical protein Efla_002914 [Eimeria flavescens]